MKGDVGYKNRAKMTKAFALMTAWIAPNKTKYTPSTYKDVWGVRRHRAKRSYNMPHIGEKQRRKVREGKSYTPHGGHFNEAGERLDRKQ